MCRLRLADCVLPKISKVRFVFSRDASEAVIGH